MMRMSVRAVRLVAVASLVMVPVAVAASPVSASSIGTQWSIPVDLSGTVSSVPGVRIAVSADGTHAAAIWSEPNGDSTLVLAKSATITAHTVTWGDPVELSNRAVAATTPDIALSADGSHATAVWSQSNIGSSLLQTKSAAFVGSTATWGDPVSLSTPGGTVGVSRVALSADGTRATALWSEANGGINMVRSASATINGNIADWGDAVDVSASGTGIDNPDFAMSADGTHATAAWSDSNGIISVVWVASATITSNTAAWSTPVSLSTSARNFPASQVSLSADGTRAAAAWTFSGASGPVGVRVASGTIIGNTAEWGTPEDPSATGLPAFLVQVALSADGTHATAIWMEGDVNNNVQLLRAASATIVGTVATWGSASNLTTPTANPSGVSTRIALSADGIHATSAWSQSDGAKVVVQTASAAISANTAIWTAASALSAPGANSFDQQIAMSANGSFTIVAWTRQEGSSYVVQAAAGLVQIPVVTLNGGATVSTDQATPAISGTTDAAPGSTVTVTVTGPTSTPLTLTAVVQADGSWTVTTSTLADGTYTVLASVIDAAAFTGTATQTLTVTSPNVAPPAAVPWRVCSGVPCAGYPSTGLHVQLQGATSCRSNNTSNAWASSVPPVVTVDAYQIGDITNQETFVVGIDGSVYHNYLSTPTEWAGWGSLSGPPSGIYGTVRAGNNYLGNQELFVRANDAQVYHLFATPGAGSGWGTWDPLGAPSAGISGDVYQGTNNLNNQELFVLGADGNVYHNFSIPGVGSGWSGWDTLGHPDGVTVTGDMQLGIDGQCNQELFVTGTDGNTYHSYATPGDNGGWSPWSTLGQPAAGTTGFASVGQNEHNNPELFIVGKDNIVYHDYATPGTGTGWSGWSSLGPPSGVVTSPSLWVDTFPVQKLTVWATTGEYSNTATPGNGSGWAGWVHS